MKYKGVSPMGFRYEIIKLMAEGIEQQIQLTAETGLQLKADRQNPF